VTRKQVTGVGFGPGLSPKASPVDTYVRPVLSQQGDSAAEGINALISALEPVMDAKYKREQAERRQRMEDEALGRIGGLTWDDAKLLKKQGKLAEHEDPFYQAALGQAYGERMALHRGNDLAKRIEGVSTIEDGSNAIDLVADDVDEILSGIIQDDMAELTENVSRSAYMRSMGRVRESLLGLATERKTKAAKEYASNAVFDRLYSEAVGGLASGDPVNEIHSRIGAQFKGNEALLRLSPAEQNQQVIRVASVLAEQGEVELVTELLYGQRKGVSGILGKTRENALKASQILELATNEAGKRNKAAAFSDRISFKDSVSNGSLDETKLSQYMVDNPGAITQAEAESWINQSRLVRENALLKQQYMRAYQDQQAQLNKMLLQVGDQGKAHLLSDIEVLTPTGKNQVITADVQREMLAETYLETKIPGETPEQRFSRLVDTFSQNGLVHKGWQQTLNAGFLSASPSTLSGGKLPAALQDSFELYKQLQAKAPEYLSSVIKNAKARDFYSMMAVATQYGGESVEAAALSAVQATKSVNNTLLSDETRKVQAEQVRELMSELEDTDYDGWFSEPDHIGNISSISQGLLKYYVMKGIEPDTAKQMTVAKMKQDYTPVQGWLVRSEGMPQGFQHIAEGFLGHMAGKLEVEAEDLALAPLGDSQGTYAVVSKAGHMYQTINGQRVFRLEDMLRFVDEAKQENAVRRSAEINAQNERKAKRRVRGSRSTR
jgi:hypothetical protein